MQNDPRYALYELCRAARAGLPHTSVNQHAERLSEAIDTAEVARAIIARNDSVRAFCEWIVAHDAEGAKYAEGVLDILGNTEK